MSRTGSIKRNMMNKQLLKDSLGWGLALWFIGYVLGIILFLLLPARLIGWAIMPIGVIITFWVLLRKVEDDSLRYYLILAIVWTAIAVVFDYLFIVETFKPADGYFKLDVYLYYAITFVSPLIAVWLKKRNILRNESPDRE